MSSLIQSYTCIIVFINHRPISISVAGMLYKWCFKALTLILRLTRLTGWNQWCWSTCSASHHLIFSCRNFLYWTERMSEIWDGSLSERAPEAQMKYWSVSGSGRSRCELQLIDCFCFLNKWKSTASCIYGSVWAPLELILILILILISPSTNM